jgi:HEAT repeat protein
VRCQAAEALGRIGAGAAGALPGLAKMVEDAGDPDAQWSAAKAIVLIGGEGARPVVPFLIRRTEVAPRGRELYQLTWLLGLLGPVAKEAVPALREAQGRDNELVTMALWAISPEDQFPWQLGYRADRPCDLWLFADYIERMGPARTKGAALALVDQILHNRSGRVPSWGYHLLRARAEVTVPVLIDALKNAPATQKRWAAWVLGRMGASAADAKPALEAARSGEDKWLADTAAEALRLIAEAGK